MSQENKRVVRLYVEAFNRGDVDAVCRLFAPDALVFGALGWGTIEQVRPVWKDLVECFGLTLHVESMAAEGDVVAVRYLERGKSLKPFRGGPPATGKAYEVVAMEWFEVRGGLIHRRWGARLGRHQPADGAAGGVSGELWKAGTRKYILDFHGSADRVECLWPLWRPIVLC
jgi:steroid delta-isomerase-like uncharacterized protein